MSAVNLFGKSPKTWVLEVCVKQMVQPLWEVKEVSPGPPPVFACKLTIAYADKVLQVEKTGKTKKEAEQEASREMLLGRNNLALTNAQLHSLVSGKRGNSSTSVPCSRSANLSEMNAGGGGEADSGAVSDTDDAEVTGDPIGELLAICIQSFLPEPKYQDTLMEGPSHKPIFTVTCVVNVKGNQVALSGRRYKKQIAKKVAAFRVLRQVNALGLKTVPLEPNKSVEKSNTSENGETLKLPVAPIDFNAITKFFDKMSASEKCEKYLSAFFKPGSRRFFTSSSDDCVSNFFNYALMYQHIVKESDTMKSILTKPMPEGLSTLTDYGGPKSVLSLVAREMNIGVTLLTPGPLLGGSSIAFVKMKFPRKFKKMPQYAVVNARGSTKEDAKRNAEIEALTFLKTTFYH